MVKNPNIDRFIDFTAKFGVSLSASNTNNLDKTKTNIDETSPTAENTTTNTQNAVANETTVNGITQATTITDEIENPFLVALINYLLEVSFEGFFFR